MNDIFIKNSIKRDELIAKFQRIYDTDVLPRIFFAPGRVNLIGEHTDYNGGHVLPCALSSGTYLAISKRDDEFINLYSANFEHDGIECLKAGDKYELGLTWTNYIKGVITLAAKWSYGIDSGFDAYFVGNIPNGAGLSSSASIEIVALTALKHIFNWDASPLTLVKIAQQAENQFIGVNCGIMDQFIIGMGKKNNAILLNTNTLKYEYAKLNLGEYKLLITNSNKKRGLADSKYNERYDECQRALSKIQTRYEIKSLGELSEAEFDSLTTAIEDPILIKRARHAVYENQRTLRAYIALNSGNLIEFGRLMNESHKSLKEDYEVSGIELDTLVEAAQGLDGVIGSRMTGAGFGGCTVTLVRSLDVDKVVKTMARVYKEKIGYDADFYQVDIGDGARELI